MSEEVVVSVDIAADRETVYSYFSDPEKVQAWLGGGNRIGRQPGDELFVQARQGPAARGRLLSAEAPRALSFSWGYEDQAMGLDVGSSIVEIELEAIDAGTRIVLRHKNIPSVEAAIGHRMGWLAYLSALANAASRGLETAGRAAIAAYFGAWTESDPARRAELLASCWAEEGQFMDAMAAIKGREALNLWIGNALAMSGGAGLAPRGEPTFCQGRVSFGWEARSGGTLLASGTNFGELDRNGRFASMVGFWNG